MKNFYHVQVNGSIHKGLEKLNKRPLIWKNAKSSRSGPELKVARILGLIVKEGEYYTITELGRKALEVLNSHVDKKVRWRRRTEHWFTCPQCNYSICIALWSREKIFNYKCPTCSFETPLCVDGVCHKCKQRTQCICFGQPMFTKKEIIEYRIETRVEVKTLPHETLPGWGG